MVDVQHSDSRIANEDGRIVWRMSIEVAEQLAMLIQQEASRTGDEGWHVDAVALLDATAVGDDQP